MIKCDLHLHSKHSNKLSYFSDDAEDQSGIPESLSEPRELYRLAMKKGMTHFTISDHESIKGCLEVADLPNTFISSEITTQFPDGVKVHVLVSDITEKQFDRIYKYRKNIYELVKLLDKEEIYYSIAHPFTPSRGKLTRKHIEQMLLLFDIFEINGTIGEENNIIPGILAGTSEKTLKKLAEIHGIENPKTGKKHLICGSDDHCGIFAAVSYTENPGKNVKDFFENAGKNKIYTENCTAKRSAHEMISSGFQYMNSKVPLKLLASVDVGLHRLCKCLLPGYKGHFSVGIRNAVSKLKIAKMILRKNPHNPVVRILKGLRDAAEKIKYEGKPEDWLFEVVSRAYRKRAAYLADKKIRPIIDDFKKRNAFGITDKMLPVVSESLNFIMSVSALIYPYRHYYILFQDSKRLAEEVASGEKTKPKIAMLTDTFYQVNGVATTLRGWNKICREKSMPCTFVTCDDKKSEFGEKVFIPIRNYRLMYYPEMNFAIPPFLEMLDWAYNEGFTHIHAATPGTMGLAALGISKSLDIPLFATWHTEVPQYAGKYAETKIVEEVLWHAMKIFHNMTNNVCVSSKASLNQLSINGVEKDKMIIIPRGVREMFVPPMHKAKNKVAELIFVGRVSREKGLDVLFNALKMLDSPYHLKVIGDGPARKELEKLADELGIKVKFMGYKRGKDLVKEYQTADVFVFPSTTDTYGNVVVEAQRCGLPVIVTDEGGPQEFMKNGKTGIVVRGNDPEAFRRGIDSMLKNPAMIEKMGKNAIEFSKDMTFTKAFIKFFEMMYGWKLSGKKAKSDNIEVKSQK